ncbi:beta-lactamase family protein [Niastella caeni]|uniref:Beta-lactamase family protein n=1 Tax=Niastella caeni TaxID=2569763 RepID=A0A4S8HIQ9_9BACT|nr:serine hydrolase domain-containing protein [Niastella caeni]THU34915.1 beta-lactamase family protein [Niastella caeni]
MKQNLTIILSLFTQLVFGQSKQANDIIRDKSFSAAIKEAEKYIDSLREKQDLPGISVCVGNKEKILWAEAFGYADVENKTKLSINSKFRIGSVSKLLTSLAVGRLYQEGKLELDAPVQRYVPDFPVKQYTVTSRQLAAHLSGIRHYRKGDPLDMPKNYKNVTEGLSIFKNDTLLFKPGTKSEYSTYGYSLLSAVIEGAAHMSFLSYMQDSIFIPFGMTHTAADINDSIIAYRVRFYDHDGKKLVNSALVNNSYKWAGGGFLSTPYDLVHMIRGLLNHKVLNEKTLELLFTPQSLENGTSTNVGIAWRINKTKSGVTYIHHGGAIQGGRTFVLFYPESGYIFAVTANVGGALLNVDEAMAVLRLFINSNTER